MRHRRSRVEAERLVWEFERSGLTRQAFCMQHGFSVASLDKYRRRCALKRKPEQPESSANRYFLWSSSPVSRQCRLPRLKLQHTLGGVG